MLRLVSVPLGGVFGLMICLDDFGLSDSLNFCSFTGSYMTVFSNVQSVGFWFFGDLSSRCGWYINMGSILGMFGMCFW